jgi:hypothetical protein
MKKLVLALVVFSLFTANADAWRRSRGYTYSYSYASLRQNIDTEKRFYNNTMSLQDLAEIRAKWMAHYNVMTHSIHSYHKHCPPWPREVTEGIGCGGPKCSTCVTGSTVVADAEARGKSGRTFRVRFFK